MTHSRLVALPACALFSALLFAPNAAQGKGAGGPGPDISKAQLCADADTQAQQLRRQEKLGATRAQLTICTDPACPQLVRDDCAQRLDDLDKIQPTLVFEVKDGNGHDLTDVKVTVDGEPLVDNVSGAAIPVEPGAHAFRFEAKGEKPVTKQLVLREGDKARHEKVVIGTATLPPPDPTRGSAQRTAGVLVGTLGVIGMGIGGVFAGLAAAKWSSAKSSCPDSKDCTTEGHTTATGDKSDALTLATVSTAAFVAGGIVTAGGIVLYVTAPSGSSKEGKPAPAQALLLVPEGGPDGAGLTLRGWF